MSAPGGVPATGTPVRAVGAVLDRVSPRPVPLPAVLRERVHERLLAPRLDPRDQPDPPDPRDQPPPTGDGAGESRHP